MFIVLEGLDGSGKTTQAKRLAQYYKTQLNTPAHVFKDPGDTPVGESLRRHLLAGDIETPEEQVLAFMLARKALMTQKIIPLLEKGEVVILDRYIWSTLVYQNTGKENHPDWVWSLIGYLELPQPNKAFLLQVSAETSISRCGGNDAFEKVDRSEVKRRAEAYRFLSGLIPINAENKTPEGITDEIISHL